MTKWLVSLTLLILAPHCAAQTVEIRFRSDSIATSRKLVRIQDVAEVTGGDFHLRSRIAELDLEDFGSSQTTIQLASDQVAYRILLDGISRSAFHIEPSNITVHQVEPGHINRMMEQLLLRDLLASYSLEESSVEWQLITSLESQVSRSGLDIATLSVQAKWPVELPVGQRAIQVTYFDSFGRSIDQSTVCKLTMFREVVRLKENVARGERIEESMIERVRRPISTSQVNLASYDQVVGKVAQSDLQPFTLVSLNAVKEKPGSPHHWDVRRNSLVDIVIKQGNLVVTLKAAKANQNGRIGDTIELINPTTRKSIQATLMDAETAVIER